jgi:hypothetical protein
MCAVVGRHKISRCEPDRAALRRWAVPATSHRNTVASWRLRFSEARIAGLHDEPRPGAPRKIADTAVERVIVDTLESKPKGATHWSTRDMAKHSGLSHSTIGRIWCAFDLQPHRSDAFQLSNDPLFIDKVRDIVGLYLDPPKSAVGSASTRNHRVTARTNR